MKSKDYLLDHLNNLVTKFPGISISYQFLKDINTHLVEVSPLSEYNENLDYKNAEADICYEFDETYTEETLLFVSEDSINRVTVPECIVSGLLFGLQPNVSVNKPAETSNEYNSEYTSAGNSAFALAA